MANNLDPKVDYAFKLLFGTPGHEPLLIDLLNAVLEDSLETPIAAVELLNPFDGKESDDDKLAILDVKARDAAGAWYNVEMQMRADGGYPARALYYWSGLFREQLHEGDDYTTMRPAIAIHFLNNALFRDSNYHLHFSLRDRCQPSLVFTPLQQIHVLQLPLLTATPETANTAIERWCYVLREGQDLDPASLPGKLNVQPIRKAMEILAMETMTPHQKEIYEGRRRARMDYTSGLFYAKKEGREEGLAEGQREALQDLLDVKFGHVPSALKLHLESMNDHAKLRSMLRQAAQAASLEELGKLWNLPAN